MGKVCISSFSFKYYPCKIAYLLGRTKVRWKTTQMHVTVASACIIFRTAPFNQLNSV